MTLLLSGLCPGDPSFQASPDLQKVLQSARLATGLDSWKDKGEALQFEGVARVRGVESPFDLVFGPEGEFRFATEGPLANTSTWNGASAWSKDAGGPARTLAPLDRGSLLLSQWVHSGYWSDPTAPLTASLIELGPKSCTLNLQLKGSADQGQLVLDTSDWLPIELRQESAGYEMSLSFEEHSEVAGVSIAHKVTFEGGGITGFVHIREAHSKALEDEHCFDLTDAKVSDTRFDPQTSPEIAIRRVRSGHLLVQPSIDGQQPAWFILDTGAGQLCIDPKYADQLELPEFGAVPAVGVAGSVLASFRQSQSFTLGPIEISDPVFVEIDLGFLEEHFGMPVAGICGYDLFARSIFELDLVTPSGAIYDPEAFELGTDQWSPLILESRLPCIECKFEGEHQGLFRIDTGDSGTITFDTPTVERLKLLEGRELSETRIGGVGGSAKASRGMLAWLELGGRRVEGIQATFASHQKGVHSKGNVLGTLGSQLFHPYRILFDYSGQRIALLPREG